MDPTLVAVVKSFMLPPGIIIILAIILGITFRKSTKHLIRIFITIIFIFYIISTPLLAKYLVSFIEPDEIFDVNKAKDAKAIIVLGCNLNFNAPEYGDKDDVSSCTLVRLRYAAEIFEKTKLPIMVCGGKVYGKSESEASVMARVLENRFNIDTVWEERDSSNTFENVKNAVAILQKENINTVILVTHAIHMKRASFSFHKNDINIIKAPTYFYSKENYNPMIVNFIPDIDALYISRFVAYETIGFIWHWFMHL